jgi:hypothetical protein
MDVMAESEDVIAHYASDVVVSMNAKTTSAISSSLTAINELNSNSPEDSTKTDMFFVCQALQAVVQELTESHRLTPEKKKCAKETNIDIPITQFAKGGASQPKTTPVKSSSSKRRSPINTTSFSTSSLKKTSTNAEDDEDDDPERLKNSITIKKRV